MLIVENLAPRVDMTLLKSNFTVVKSAVSMLTLPGYTMRLLPTIRWTRFCSYFSDCMLHTNFPYIDLLSFGICLIGMKNIVSVPVMSLIPCANLPSLFTKALSQISFRDGSLKSWVYSIIFLLFHSLLLQKSGLLCEYKMGKGVLTTCMFLILPVCVWQRFGRLILIRSGVLGIGESVDV